MKRKIELLVKLTAQNTIVTTFTGTFKEAQAYYAVGKEFDMAGTGENPDIQTVVSMEEFK